LKTYKFWRSFSGSGCLHEEDAGLFWCSQQHHDWNHSMNTIFVTRLAFAFGLTAAVALIALLAQGLLLVAGTATLIFVAVMVCVPDECIPVSAKDAA
jgi:FtsH-binding integral membrane protein